MSAEVRVTNVTRDTLVVDRGRVADNFLRRLRGLIGSRPLSPGEGLLIVPCRSIHTHFMTFPIDVLYLDQAQRVVGIDEHLRPWRLGHSYKDVRVVLELPAGSAGLSETRVGDELLLDGYDLR